jgi:hypothetical protein
MRDAGLWCTLVEMHVPLPSARTGSVFIYFYFLAFFLENSEEKKTYTMTLVSLWHMMEFRSQSTQWLICLRDGSLVFMFESG